MINKPSFSPINVVILAKSKNRKSHFVVVAASSAVLFCITISCIYFLMMHIKRKRKNKKLVIDEFNSKLSEDEILVEYSNIFKYVEDPGLVSRDLFTPSFYTKFDAKAKFLSHFVVDSNSLAYREVFKPSSNKNLLKSTVIDGPDTAFLIDWNNLLSFDKDDTKICCSSFDNELQGLSKSINEIDCSENEIEHRSEISNNEQFSYRYDSPKSSDSHDVVAISSKINKKPNFIPDSSNSRAQANKVFSTGEVVEADEISFLFDQINDLQFSKINDKPANHAMLEIPIYAINQSIFPQSIETITNISTPKVVSIDSKLELEKNIIFEIPKIVQETSKKCVTMTMHSEIKLPLDVMQSDNDCAYFNDEMGSIEIQKVEKVIPFFDVINNSSGEEYLKAKRSNRKEGSINKKKLFKIRKETMLSVDLPSSPEENNSSFILKSIKTPKTVPNPTKKKSIANIVATEKAVKWESKAFINHFPDSPKDQLEPQKLKFEATRNKFETLIREKAKDNSSISPIKCDLPMSPSSAKIRRLNRRYESKSSVQIEENNPSW
jgi:hypothetical protein